MTEPLKAKLTPDADSASQKNPDSTAGADHIVSEPPKVAEPPDPFDPASLRLDQSFATPSVRKLLTTVPIRKPLPQHFVRVHPDPDFRGIFGLVEFKEDREFFLLTPAIAHELPGEFHSYVIHTAVTRQEKVFLWPVKLPEPDGRQNEWHKSAADAALRAQNEWVRMRADMHLGAYEISVAEAVLSEPIWPDCTFRDLLRIGFRDRLVDNLDHLVVKKLRGLA